MLWVILFTDVCAATGETVEGVVAIKGGVVAAGVVFAVCVVFFLPAASQGLVPQTPAVKVRISDRDIFLRSDGVITVDSSSFVSVLF